MLNHANKRRGGYTLLEAIVAAGMLVGIIALMTEGFAQLARHSAVLTTHQQAMLAAESVLNQIRDGNEPTALEFSERFSGMSCQTRRDAGSGDWAGFSRVIVEVSTTANENTPVRVRLAGYVHKRETE